MVREFRLESERTAKSFQVDYAAELNAEQLAAVEAGEGPILLIAGAGSGKTRTITYRVARLIESGVEPSAILLLTFTNKAAREMLSRVQRLIGAVALRVLGGTFHHVGHLVLRSHAARVDRQPNFTIADREDARALLSECVEQSGVERGTGFPKADVIGDWISFAHNTGDPLARVVEARSWEHLERIDEIGKVAALYERRKAAGNLCDFDDLLVLWKRVLQEHADVRAAYQDRFRYLLVDEYQDTNRLQGELIDLMAGERRNITVVGDDAQSIYAWRGAHYANIMTFPERYPGTRIWKLETNYRSTPEILALANDSIRHNSHQFEKALRAVRPSGSLPIRMSVGDDEEQAQFVAGQIRRLNEDHGIPFQEMAVLYRAHHHAMKIDLTLTRRGIPFVMRSGVRFFEQAHIKDVMAYLRIVANPRDESAWKRVFQHVPGVGKTTAQKLWTGIEACASPLDWVTTDAAAAMVSKSKRTGWRAMVGGIGDLRDPELRAAPNRMLDAVCYGGYRNYLKDAFPDADDRAQDLDELIGFAERFTSLEDLIGQVSLQGNTGDIAAPGQDEDGAVVLSTIHQAKGLEWSVVFVIWLADGSFPLQRAMENLDAIEEERRLFYVAVTRAKDELYLSHPTVGRGGSWSGSFLQPSMFLQELAAKYTEEGRISRG